ncbi:CHRD domain-containing protein [Roseisolibacter agri]|nr:CHRD domain-containing protein [Roseisolibacter agri]
MPSPRSIALLGAVLVLAACADRHEPIAPASVRLSIVPGAAHGGHPLATPMTQEVTTTPPYWGDPDGSGSALITINPGQEELCWQLDVSGVALSTAAHIHRAPAGVRGGIVVTLTPPDASGRSVGCTTSADRALLKEILASPESFYVNVHTGEFPQGAVRGQLDG